MHLGSVESRIEKARIHAGYDGPVDIDQVQLAPGGVYTVERIP